MVKNEESINWWWYTQSARFGELPDWFIITNIYVYLVFACFWPRAPKTLGISDFESNKGVFLIRLMRWIGKASLVGGWSPGNQPFIRDLETLVPNPWFLWDWEGLVTSPVTTVSQLCLLMKPITAPLKKQGLRASRLEICEEQVALLESTEAPCHFPFLPYAFPPFGWSLYNKPQWDLGK